MMNRFRTKKRAKEAAAEAVARGSTDSEGPSLPAAKSMPFRLGKKQQQPEPRLELDLANALPSSDNFRTSLLMNGLSARFSMLREQDDPNSKIGKASDDSVIFPKNRQSRLNDFGFQSHGLADIAEVSSIDGSARPGFAATRADSYRTTGSNGTDEDSLNGGSVMNRGKPGEGNNLFGGRQKIYKIPIGASGSTKSLVDGPSNSAMAGRAIYQSDVSQSAFQKLRDREKAQQREEEEDSDHFARSTPGYNRNRETSSTTSSAGPSMARSSTAATSITSQRTPSLSGPHAPISPVVSNPVSPIERPVAKGRRLYETGLDQHLHEQQFSAMNRIDTLTRQRALGSQTPPPGHISPTGAPPTVDKWDPSRSHVIGKASMPNMRTASPSPTTATMGAFDQGIRPARPSEPKQAFGMPPLSPPISENEDAAVLAVQPNDRGKATALGTFTKPALPYDENKYSQRQLQMQQGRETPPLRKPSPPHPPRPPRAKASAQAAKRSSTPAAAAPSARR